MGETDRLGEAGMSCLSRLRQHVVLGFMLAVPLKRPLLR